MGGVEKVQRKGEERTLQTITPHSEAPGFASGSSEMHAQHDLIDPTRLDDHSAVLRKLTEGRLFVIYDSSALNGYVHVKGLLR
jgi:hypothetical protein